MTDEKHRSGGAGADPLSKRILNSIKPFSGEHTSKWLAALSTDAVEDSVEIKGDADPNQEPPRSMPAWVDNLFDHFQRYTFDFSRMCSEPELQVNCTRPTLQEAKAPGQESSITSIGYLSTNQWALVVRGEFFKIQAYVIPVGVLMGFNSRHHEFPLYMEMVATQNKSKINWQLDNQPVAMDQSSAIAKKLFAHLVMVARGEARDTDKFSLNQYAPPPPGLPARTSSFAGANGNQMELLKPEWLLDENPPQPLPQPAQQQSAQPYPGPTPQPMSTQQGQGAYPAPASPTSAPMHTSAPVQRQNSVQDLLQQNLVVVLNECNQFAEVIDQQLELLTPIGVKSIQNQDMETASEIMQRAKRLKALLDSVVKFSNEWRGGLK
jgi:hypothetical protein